MMGLRLVTIREHFGRRGIKDAMAWSLEAKLGIGVALVLATSVAVGVKSCQSARHLREISQQASRATDLEREVTRLRLAFEEAETAASEYVIAGRNTDRGVYDRATKEVTEDLARLYGLAASQPDQRASLPEIESLLAGADREFAAAMERRGKDGLAPARRSAREPVRKAADAVRERIDALDADAARRAEQESRLAQAGSQEAVRSLAALTGLACVLVFLAYILVRRDVSRRSRAERALGDSEERFRQVSNSLEDILWAASPGDARSVYVSAAYERITGQPTQRFRANPNSFLDLVHPADRQRTGEALAAQLRGELESTEEYRIVRADGSTRWLRSRAFPVRGKSQGICSVVGITEDVTDRRRTEDALRHSEDQVRLVVEGLKDVGIVMLDPLGKVVSWNAGAERLTGYKAEEVIGHGVSLFYSREDLAASLPELILQKALADGKSESEGWRIRKDGSRFWADTLTTALRDAEGNVRGFGRVTRDTTERKLVEEARRESERRYRLLFERNLAGVCLAGPGGRILNCNEAFAEIFGYEERAGILTRTVWDLYFDPAERAAVQARLRSGSFSGVEFRGRRKDGTPVWLLGSMTRIQAQEGAEEVTQATVIDITRQKEAESISQSLLHISEKLNSTLEVDALLDYLVAETITLMHAEGGCSGLRVRGALLCHKVMRVSGSVPVKYSWLPGQGSPGWVLVSKTPCVSNDARSDNRVARELVDRFGIRSLATMPLLDAQDKVVAFFEIHNKADASGFTSADQKILLAISQVASVAIQKALAYRQAYRAEDKLRHLSGQLLRSQDEERRRIARELHDSTAQCMAALVMNLTQLGQRLEGAGPAAQDTLADSLALAEHCAREVRTLSYLLHPPLLDEIGLGAALRQYVDGFVRRSGVRVYLNVPEGLGRLPVEHATTLFRIVQEGLTNIHKHSGSLTADVLLIRLNGDLVLEVADQGRGFPAGALDNLDGTLRGLGVGIAGMQERLRQLGGRLEIKSGDGGTTIQATLPFNGHGP